MNYSMRRIVVVSGVVGAFVAPTFVGAQSPQGAPRQIITTGVGEARIVPDRATIMIGVQSHATTAAAASADNGRRQRAVLDTIKAMGVSADQISSINFSVQPEIAWGGSPQTPPKVTGYTVSNTVRVDVRKLDDIGRLLDASLAKGANNINGLQFYSSKADSVRRVAVAAAVVSARADAEAIAKAGGGSLGQLIEVATGANDRQRPWR